MPQKFLVFFDFDKSNVRADADEDRRGEAADYAKKNGKVVIHTTGHTDRAGSDAYNMALSERRAKAVEAELAQARLHRQPDPSDLEGRERSSGEDRRRRARAAEPPRRDRDGLERPANREFENPPSLPATLRQARRFS